MAALSQGVGKGADEGRELAVEVGVDRRVFKVDAVEAFVLHQRHDLLHVHGPQGLVGKDVVDDTGGVNAAADDRRHMLNAVACIDRTGVADDGAVGGRAEVSGADDIGPGVGVKSGAGWQRGGDSVGLGEHLQDGQVYRHGGEVPAGYEAAAGCSFGAQTALRGELLRRHHL